jgi:uncharacterized protein YndB with AHSA1/START domain
MQLTQVQEAVTLARAVNGSREQAWEAWTRPELLARWWWPERFQTRYEVDLRSGGAYRFRTVELPDIGILSLAGTYQEVSAPERLVYTWRWENVDELPTVVTVRFEERGQGTQIHVTHEGFPSEEERDNHVVGWTDCLDRLEALLGAHQG